MPYGEEDAASRTVELLSAFFTASDRVAADPQGVVVALHHFLLRWFHDSSEVTVLLLKFQTEPTNPAVRTAVLGRITEALLNSPEFADQLHAALRQVAAVTNVVPPQQKVQYATVHQTRSTGNVATVGDTTGAVNIKQRTVRIGRLQIPVPVLALLLLFGGGVTLGTGAAVVSAVSSDAGSYAYYGTDEGRGELFYIQWTTRKDGTLTGTMVNYSKDRSKSAVPVAVTGHQDGRELDLTASVFGTSFNYQGTIDGDTLTIQGMGDSGRQTFTLRKTAPDEFTQILNEFRAVS